MTLNVSIRRLWDETPEIRCFELAPVDGIELPPAEPGAHIDVYPGGGLVRQYSLWNGPDERDRYLIGVKREPASRGGSAAMHCLAEGERLLISEPKNRFPLSHISGASVLLAGGIGVTPLLSMARHLEAGHRAFELHLFARSKQHSPFAAMIEDKLGATIHLGLDPLQLETVFSGLLRRCSTDAHLYLCGPAPFMALAQKVAADIGWPSARIHLEHFAAAESAPDPAGEAFEVVLKKTGRTILVGPDQSIVEAMEKAGCGILTSCEQGVCGTCTTRVIDGDPDHRDLYLSIAEQKAGLFTPCVSRSKSKRLVLDL